MAIGGLFQVGEVSGLRDNREVAPRRESGQSGRLLRGDERIFGSAERQERPRKSGQERSPVRAGGHRPEGCPGSGD